MADIRFEGEYAISSSQRQQKNSRMTQFFIDKSFGLISTPAQATVIQFIVAVIFFVLAAMFLSKAGDQNAAIRTTPEVLNTPIPTRPGTI